MLKKPAAAVKLAVLSSAILIFSAFNIISALIPSPQNLSVSVESSKAMLAWDAPESGTSVKYYIYKAYGADENTDPSSLEFTRSDSTSETSYSDDLSSLSSSAPVAFYYVTAVDENGSESTPSNSVNAAAPLREESDGDGE